MGEPKPKQAQRNAGAFIGPDILAPVPMRTLSDDYHDVPAEPEDSDRVPPPRSAWSDPAAPRPDLGRPWDAPLGPAAGAR